MIFSDGLSVDLFEFLLLSRLGSLIKPKTPSVLESRLFFFISLYFERPRYLTRTPVVVAFINSVKRATPATCRRITSYMYLGTLSEAATIKARDMPTAPRNPAYEQRTT